MEIKKTVNIETAYSIAIRRIMELEKECILKEALIKELEKELEKFQSK